MIHLWQRKITTDDATSSLLWGCRSVLSFLLVCSSKQGNLMDSIGTEKVKADVISIDRLELHVYPGVYIMYVYFVIAFYV